MKSTRLIMGMPIEIEVVGDATESVIEQAFSYLVSVDARFSTYKEDSEISRMNRGEIRAGEESDEMKEVLRIAEKTKQETVGYFDIQRPDTTRDPSGIVKGWAILNTARIIARAGQEDYVVNAGGDIASAGKNSEGAAWAFGIRHPFIEGEVVKVVYPKGKGVATSGSYVRGDHIYNPHEPEQKIRDIVSITVIGPNVLEADRFATAAFAMGKRGAAFIEQLPGFEAYQIDAHGVATMTSGFEEYTKI